MKKAVIKLLFVGVTFVVSLFPVLVMAELTVASPFTDNAVLQRGMPVPVWGTADARAKVYVRFSGQTKSTVANASGKWKLVLDAMPANAEPQLLQISDLKSQLVLSNVLVGEVWICSGQSNMQMGHQGIQDIKALIPSAKNIRTVNVKRTVSMTENDHHEGEWLEQLPGSAVAFSFAYFLEQAGDVPVGIILAAWGSSSIEAWMPRDMTETVPHFKTMMDEFDADTVTRERIASILEGDKPWSRQDDIFLRRQSNILYNAMIHPLVPYACRGLVWYQGERNTQSMHGMVKQPWFSRNSGMLKYGDTLKAWMQRYRQEWGQDEFHFLAVMLPGYYKPLKTGPKGDAENPNVHSWGWMRESQLKALEMEDVFVANTIDLGDVKNIHPKDKLPIGRRLALLAARETLGQDIEAEGPMMQRVEVRRGQLVVNFDHADGLKTTDGNAPTGFWLSDNSAKWVKAEAKIKGNTIVLSASELSKPRYVRYAFAGKPNVNLVNAAMLPAYPFRTDSFKP